MGGSDFQISLLSHKHCQHVYTRSRHKYRQTQPRHPLHHSISQTDDKISITIKDDGMGMDQQKHHLVTACAE
ncbi:hypothetical protein PO124_02060 [Bacillus licheniformis]|nr:hypothetical protein [Bacillus licheniformis]